MKLLWYVYDYLVKLNETVERMVFIDDSLISARGCILLTHQKNEHTYTQL